nr:immunoglobulin light chain junction region [Macaca mulatta]MPN85173.1 immunoglobulin light chain junction region [Macaca mulatta]MPN85178.1 immunoglobulin light chain junction region [Macaca mulatta]MPN85184.1 immunoglobulin light chain junction region [Macaca mulatta]MPN85188.1 immunoglobulin light chain junction region [Macaca mulatta]
CQVYDSSAKMLF